jgi:ribonuclease D
MIYIVTNQSFEPFFDGVTFSTIEVCLNYFKNKKELGVDFETEGFDPFTKKALTLQLGDEENQFIIDVSTIDLKHFKELLETKTIILHNAKFDLKFLYYHGIIPYNNVFDTFLAERTISLGIDSHRKALDFCVYRHLQVVLDKSTRGLIHRLGIFHPRVIKYSANDVKYSIPLKRKQQHLLKKLEFL